MQKNEPNKFIEILYTMPLVLIFLVFIIYFVYTCTISDCGYESWLLALPMLAILFMVVIIRYRPDKILTLFIRKIEGR